MLVSLAFILLLVACGGGAFPGDGAAKNGAGVSISRSKVTVPSRGVQQFTAIVNGAYSQRISWSATAGTITSTGLYRAPAVTTVSTALVTARSMWNRGIAATAIVTIQPATTLPLAPGSISPATVTVKSGASQQFTTTLSGLTNDGVVWSSTDGTVTSDGLFTAPGVNANTTVTVEATSRADSTKSAVATVTVLAQLAQHSVNLSWNASPAPNIVGYNVYRAQALGGPYSMINSGGPVASTVYADASVANGTTYFYVTTVVNSSGRESAYSNQAQAAIPR